MSAFFHKTTYNNETLNQLWMSIIADSHDICCSCYTPFAHLLDSIFPEGHQDRHKTIADIIQRDYQQCHSGGIEEENHGLADTKEKDSPTKREDQEEGYIGDEELEELVAVAENAATR